MYRNNNIKQGDRHFLAHIQKLPVRCDRAIGRSHTDQKSLTPFPVKDQRCGAKRRTADSWFLNAYFYTGKGVLS